MAYKNTGAGKAVPGKVHNSFKLSNFSIEDADLKIRHKEFLISDVIPKLKDGVVVKLIGLTDRTGTDEYNDRLADKRIESVVSFLKMLAPGPFQVQRSRVKGEKGAALMGLADNSESAEFRAVLLLVGDARAKPEVPKPRPRMDFIIRFSGNDTDGVLDSERVISSATIKRAAIYQGLLDSGRRILNRFGHLTADANRKGIRDDLRAIVAGAKRFDTLGIVIVIGSSSGGNNAIAMVKELATDGIDIQLLTVSDPAFFPNEARPRTIPGGTGLATPIPIPSFSVGSVPAGEKLNFFQTKGNATEFSFRQGRSIYASDMLNKEIHGKIDGFDDRDLSHLCIRSDHDGLHAEIINLAVPRIGNAVVSVLDRAESFVPSVTR